MFKLFGLIIVFVVEVECLNNGLALKPPMGWMSWGYYECNVDCSKNTTGCLNEQLIMNVADHLYNDGFIEAGYEYIVIDDCWSDMERDEQGRLKADPKRFPRGMKFLADYIHARGLKFGMYTNVGDVTCKGFPASRRYLEIDAETFAQWEIDYLKVDGCFVSFEELNTAYITLGNALNNTGRPIVYSCSWPYYIQFIYHKEPDFAKVAKHCNLFRNFHDIFPVWENVQWVVQFYMENYDLISQYNGPGHWFDPDMLLVGRNSLPENQNRVQIAVYAMFSSPFFISCDMNKITKQERNLLLNMDLLTIAQDRLGMFAKPHMLSQGMILWVKIQEPLKGDRYPSFSFAFFNHNLQNTTDVELFPKDYGLNSTDGYAVLDVFKRKFLQNVSLHDAIFVSVPSEDIVLYTLFPL